MNFTVEVLLKGREDVVARPMEHQVAPGEWTDEDVRELLHMALREFEQALTPDADERRCSRAWPLRSRWRPARSSRVRSTWMRNG